MDLLRANELVREVAELEPELQELPDSTLRERARGLRRRVADEEPAPRLQVESFALVREASRRVLGLRPYDVQIAAGAVLHQGAIAEMQTGEGKTLAAVAPVFMATLAGRGAHVLTFNDYLARRDAGWMGPLYRFLGVSVGHIQAGSSTAERQAAYRQDVTYLTAREAGFDYLRDGLCLESSDRVHRAFHFALVDEADSILIDEARIPLVIAGAFERVDPGLATLAGVVRRLEEDVDFDSDGYGRNIFLTERGSQQAEDLLATGSLFAPENLELLAALRNALHAEYLLRRDVDYIVRGNGVELVDEHTGRVAENRQWPDGLQAAVEAKEGLAPGVDGRILGSITLQHFLGLYPHLCGMTATARPAAGELSEFYGLQVTTIPPNRPCIRSDEPDRMFTHGPARERAVVAAIRRAHRRGRPVLVGTSSVAESESLAAALEYAGVDCRVLNAKNDEREAAIIAEAGALGAVTISTNMAGRGTDIRLGGAREEERDRVLALGGLHVIGTHRHESRRIDDQLRGRSGRQGDPGGSRFFISLDDDLPRRYGIERLIPRKLYPADSDTPLESPVVRREMDRSQRIVEGQAFDIRKRLFEYSRIIEDQRTWIRQWRDEILAGERPPEHLASHCPDRWTELEALLGRRRAREVENRLTLLVIDRCWSDHLTEMQAIRDEIHLVALDGRSPLAEFYRTAIQGFEDLLVRIDREIADQFLDLDFGPEGIDWKASSLQGPAATWTYLVNDDVLGTNLLGTLANRPTIALWGVLLLWPVLFAWGIHLRLKNRRRRREAEASDSA